MTFPSECGGAGSVVGRRAETLFQRMAAGCEPRASLQMPRAVFQTQGDFPALHRTRVAADIARTLNYLHECEAFILHLRGKGQIPECCPVQLLHRHVTPQAVLISYEVGAVS
jgi:hypothetical protein